MGAAGLGIVSMVGGSHALGGPGLGELTSITANGGAEQAGQKDREPAPEEQPGAHAPATADPTDGTGGDKDGTGGDRAETLGTSEATAVPCNSSELVSALVRANNEGGGNIALAAGCTYTLAKPDQSDAESGLPVIYHPITINGAGATISRSTDAAVFRFFTVRGGGELKLVDLTLTNGRAANGGSIQVDHDATAAVERVTITQSTALAAEGGGGAIFNDGHMTVVDSKFHDNQAAGASGKGGAILNGGVFTMADSEFTNNSANAFGGGFANFQGAADVATTAFTYNNATEGGGIASVNARTKVWDTDVIRNFAKVGGGILNRDAVITLRNLTVHRNTSTTNGGGIATVNGLVAADDSFIEENTGRGNGAGIFAEKSTLLVRGTEVNRNSGVGALSKGGGIHAEKGQVSVFKSRLTENNSTAKPGGFFAKDAKTKIDGRSSITKNRPVNCGNGIEHCSD